MLFKVQFCIFMEQNLMSIDRNYVQQTWSSVASSWHGNKVDANLIQTKFSSADSLIKENREKTQWLILSVYQKCCISR